MSKLRLIDARSRAGTPGTANEDSFGYTGDRAFVVDGATGLSDDERFANYARDLSEIAAQVFSNGAGKAVPNLVHEICRKAQKRFSPTDIPKWQLPVASFQLVEMLDGEMISWGLGDCRLIVIDNAERAVLDTSAWPGSRSEERARAEKFRREAQGLEARDYRSRLLAMLRDGRATYNTLGGQFWTLGTEPGASHHVAVTRVSASLCKYGLLCTDGFASISDDYNLMSPSELVCEAIDVGLDAILDKIRHIEQKVDPEARMYARFKQSDDATAVLFEIVS